MTDVTASEHKDDDDEAKEETTPPPPLAAVPPLVAAAQRLERLLGKRGLDLDQQQRLPPQRQQALPPQPQQQHFYTNPVKVVRRWLGTSSGAAAAATVADVQAAARILLDPAGPSAAGRRLLSAGGGGREPPPPPATAATDTGVPPGYLTLAASREIELWLISLAVRLLWRQHADRGPEAQPPSPTTTTGTAAAANALALAEQGLALGLHHVDAAAAAGGASSLFPLVARLYRFQALAAELQAAAGRHGTTAAHQAQHNLATLRRDVDSQATLLNAMLRELLRNAQGTVGARNVVVFDSFARFERGWAAGSVTVGQ